MNSPTPVPALTEIEKRCLALAAVGRTPAEIARETELPLPRVTGAIESATEKLGKRNVLGAITCATRLRLI